MANPRGCVSIIRFFALAAAPGDGLCAANSNLKSTGTATSVSNVAISNLTMIVTAMAMKKAYRPGLTPGGPTASFFH
jgi:hypothetical protein